MSATPESLAGPQPALLRHRSFVAYWCARTATNGGYQMQAVAVGWQIYELTGSAFDLGLVGLVQFFPVVVLGIVAGHIADRYDRRVVVGTCQVIKALAAAAFAIGTIGGFLSRDVMLAILFVSGTARAFETPTMHTLVPGVVPPELLTRAIAASATASQTATICGPAIGGLMYAFGAATVYLTCTAIFVMASALISLIVLRGAPPAKKPVTMETLFAGFSYIRHNRVVLGAISLDLFAMLLGGVTALLPVYAKDVLVAGPWGLGLLRSAPAIGALLTSGWLAHHQIERRTGHVLFAAVAVFGLATIVFAFSTSLVLSIAALAVYGACDAISVVIRHSLVQTRTPNEMLGRVMAVNFMFTGTSGTLGEFRAGSVAAGFGAFTSVLVGGVGAILVALLWMRWFPEIARIDKIQAQHN
ncbi:MFS transporter [Rhodoplanes sp. Z2-YC6860]|uniref:MFS transporter n=1 Tax=Rhodoplanes sp. Z2-YC6860 TaxID=674703 RepID=UPI00078E6894|nr:MFS transporter [Rhodoplanes sp. Z2-YC6860]AMN43331.1 major facilitator superfamily protein [Rhodoplanes sp. Z2-YC6860]